MGYVDGFLIAVPEDALGRYREIAATAGEVWMEYGALAYVECVADDTPFGEVTSFPRAVDRREGETVVFSWIAYRSRAHRDEVNAKVMADPRIRDSFGNMPFDTKRMIWGGFRTLLEYP